jgi:DNA-binding NarL/FixJ family response regulator
VATSVLIVDDDAMVRAGLRLVLSADPTLSVAGEAGNGREAVESVRRAEPADRPDVILMDLQMPVLDGIAATAELRRLPAAPPVLILTTFQLDDRVLLALQAGASGYLLKDTNPIDIARGVHVAASGGSVFSASIAERLVRQAGPDPETQRLAEDAAARLARLTDRERAVAEAVAEGKSNATIAAELFMSEPTVKTHVSRALAKLGADNRVQIALAVYTARGRR